ncbi:hypothetical protein G7Z98_09535 [Pseudomonas stutzeri]|nr:hypothetical protein [Stutzerimonas stutzeri]
MRPYLLLIILLAASSAFADDGQENVRALDKEQSMTVQTNTNVASFTGNGVTVDFPFGFKFNSAADLIVALSDVPSGVATELTLNSDYTASGAGNEEGGAIHLLIAAPTNQQKVKIVRKVDILQLTDLRNQGKFYAEVHEDVFDLLIMIDQQQQTEIDDANAKSDEAVATANAANAKSDQAVAKAAQNLVDMQAQYDAFEQGASFVVIGDYAAGLVVDGYNKVFRKDGEFYRAKAETTLPYPLNGDWAVDAPKFVSVGDAVLRQELAAPNGALAARNAMIYVDSVADMLAIDSSRLIDGQAVYVNDIGREYYWNAALSKFNFEYDLFVIYGQSNAFGFAGGSAGRQALPPEAYYWTNRVGTPQWAPLSYEMQHVQEGTPNSSGHAWVEFAREYTKKTGRGVLYLPAAMGGKTLDELAQGTVYYNRLLLSMGQINADTAYPIRGKFLLFSHGESDMSIGTSRDQYQTKLVNLWSALKADAGLAHLYMSKVGSPQDRAETSRYPIQVAQDYVAANLADVSMAFDAASSFTTANGMLQDGVHYSQKGYNLMGREMGKFAADREQDASNITPLQTAAYSRLSTPGDVQHRVVGCTLINDGSQWQLKSLTDGGVYRSAIVQSVTVEATRIVLVLGMRITDVITMQARLNDIGNAQGLTAGVSLGSSNNSIVIELRSDITAFVDTTTGAVTYPPNGSGADTGLLSDLSAVIDTGITKLTYLGSDMAPLVLPMTTSSLSEFIPIAQKPVSGTSIWFKYQSAVTEKRAIVRFTGKRINPSSVKLNGLQLNFFAILGERSL